MQFLAAETEGFIVLMLLHGNIYSVTVASVCSIRYLADPNFIYVYT